MLLLLLITSKKPTKKKTETSKKPTKKKTVTSKKPTKKKTVTSKKPTKKKTAASKKPTKKKTVASKKQTKKNTVAAATVDDNDCSLRVGMKVSGKWDDGEGEGDWYDGVVQSIDYVERTVHILYEDGDRDDAVPWKFTRILDDVSLGDG